MRYLYCTSYLDGAERQLHCTSVYWNSDVITLKALQSLPTVHGAQYRRAHRFGSGAEITFSRIRECQGVVGEGGVCIKAV